MMWDPERYDEEPEPPEGYEQEQRARRQDYVLEELRTWLEERRRRENLLARRHLDLLEDAKTVQYVSKHGHWPLPF